MRFTVKLFASLLLGTALPLAGCHKAAQRSAAPDAKPGLSLSDAVLALPAVKGNPGAAYFTLVNASAANATVAAVSVTGADKGEMHQTSGTSMAAVSSVVVKPGATLKFAPGGFHVMVFGIAPTLEAGGSSEITVTFADGDKVSAPLKLEAAGAMTMDHGETL